MSFWKKLSSRKLWAAIAGIATGMAMVFGVDESVITTVAGAVTALASVVTYIVTEGKVDAESVANAIRATEKAQAAIEESEEK